MKLSRISRLRAAGAKLSTRPSAPISRPERAAKPKPQRTSRGQAGNRPASCQSAHVPEAARATAKSVPPPGRPAEVSRPAPARHGLARVLSKAGYCSRTEAARLVLLGRVTLNGRVCRNAEQPASLEADEIAVDGERIEPARRVYILLNKPRGLVTTSADEHGRETVFSCLITERAAESAGGAPELFHRKKATRTEFRLPGHLSAVGRLDQASEGLLLFTNDNGWAERLTSPQHHLDKVYHVQINTVADAALCQRLGIGAESEGELLRAKKATVLRLGEANSWLEITLDEGRNRHIRRLLAACGLEVLRLIRVSVGALKLGSLGKGQWRHLTPREVQAFFPKETPAPAEAQVGPNAPAVDSERAPWKRPARRL